MVPEDTERFLKDWIQEKMKDYNKILKSDERAVFDLLDLYSRYGYSRFKSGKFEEYELYARNRDFIGQDAILTFTDSSGRLMALKPDVTLSIVKNTKDIKNNSSSFVLYGVII